MIPESLLRAFTSPLFPLGEQSISLLWLLQVASLLVAVSLVARAIKFLLKDRLLPRFQIPEGRREATATLTSLGVTALGYVLVVQGMGLDFGALAVLLGALGVGLGFGLQDLTRNLSGGLTLLMEGKLKVGDLIEFNQTAGYIKQISIRSTVISTFQGSDAIVPNSFLTSIPVQNHSYSNFTGRIDVPVMVAHDSDVLGAS
jgi:small-conductance mechanosensitive channel